MSSIRSTHAILGARAAMATLSMQWNLLHWYWW